MSDPVTSALAQIAERRNESFVIVTDTSRENLFAQFIAVSGEPGLYGELVSNEYLPPDEHLTPAQEDDLRARGWEHKEAENWSRTWPDATTEADFQAVALEVLQTLRDVYGAKGEVEVEVELLDDVTIVSDVSAPGPPRSPLLLLLIGLALLGVLAALILSR